VLLDEYDSLLVVPVVQLAVPQDELLVVMLLALTLRRMFVQ
jgi:hypothetical protein